MALTWDKYVPDSVATPTAIPLDWHRLIQQNIPVLVTQVLSAVGGTAVSLPADFTSQISAAGEYTVMLTPQSFSASMGQIYVANKTTAGFDVEVSGDIAGETIGVVVFWVRP